VNVFPNHRQLRKSQLGRTWNARYSSPGGTSARTKSQRANYYDPTSRSALIRRAAGPPRRNSEANAIKYTSDLEQISKAEPIPSFGSVAFPEISNRFYVQTTFRRMGVVDEASFSSTLCDGI